MNTIRTLKDGALWNYHTISAAGGNSGNGSRFGFECQGLHAKCAHSSIFLFYSSPWHCCSSCWHSYAGQPAGSAMHRGRGHEKRKDALKRRVKNNEVGKGGLQKSGVQYFGRVSAMLPSFPAPPGGNERSRGSPCQDQRAPLGRS